MLKKLLPAAGLVMAALAAVPAHADPMTITFWHSLGNEGEKAIDAIADAFNTSQSQYVVKPEFVGPYNDAIVKLQAAIPAHRQPDLMMLEVTRYGLFADAGVLAPLDPFFAKEGAHFTDRFKPFALNAAKYLGKSYVLPVNVSTPVMFYNKDLFRAAGLDPAKPPKTWDELLADGEKLTVRDGDQTKQWGITGLSQFVRWAFIDQAGGEWIDPTDNSVRMDSPETIKAHEYLVGLIRKYKVASVEAAIDEKIGKQYFLNSQAAISFGSTGDFGSLRKAAKFDLGVAPLPCDVKCAAPIGGATVGIAAASDAAHQAGAWAFLKFMTTPEMIAKIFVGTGYLPIVKGTEDVPIAKAAIEKEPGYSVAIKQLDVAFARPRPPAMPAMRTKEQAVWQSMVVGKQTPAEALKAFAAEMRQMLGS